MEKMDVPNRETLEHRAKRFCKFLLPICRGPAGKMKYLTDKRRKTETVPEAGKTTNKSEDEPSQENCSIYDVWCLSGRKRTVGLCCIIHVVINYVSFELGADKRPADLLITKKLKKEKKK